MKPDDPLLKILACPLDKGPLHLLVPEADDRRRPSTTRGCAAATRSSTASRSCCPSSGEQVSDDEHEELLKRMSPMTALAAASRRPAAAHPAGRRRRPGRVPALRTGAGPARRPVPGRLRHGGGRRRLVRPVDAPAVAAGAPGGDRRAGPPSGPAARPPPPRRTSGSSRPPPPTARARPACGCRRRRGRPGRLLPGPPGHPRPGAGRPLRHPGRTRPRGRRLRQDRRGRQRARRSCAGRRALLARDRPALFIELESRIQPIAPVVTYLSLLGYEGWVLPGPTPGCRWPLHLEAHQARRLVRRHPGPAAPRPALPPGPPVRQLGALPARRPPPGARGARRWIPCRSAKHADSPARSPRSTSSWSCCAAWPTTTRTSSRTPATHWASPSPTCARPTAAGRRCSAPRAPAAPRPATARSSAHPSRSCPARIGDLDCEACCGPSPLARPALRGAAGPERRGVERVAGPRPGRARPPSCAPSTTSPRGPARSTRRPAPSPRPARWRARRRRGGGWRSRPRTRRAYGASAWRSSRGGCCSGWRPGGCAAAGLCRRPFACGLAYSGSPSRGCTAARHVAALTMRLGDDRYRGLVQVEEEIRLDEFQLHHPRLPRRRRPRGPRARTAARELRHGGQRPFGDGEFGRGRLPRLQVRGGRPCARRRRCRARARRPCGWRAGSARRRTAAPVRPPCRCPS